MKTIPKIMLIVALTMILNSSAKSDNEKCFRCHASPTLKEIDEESGIVKDFYVNPINFALSNHGKLECKFCHGDSYETWPHNEHVKTDFTCTKCHSGNSTFLNENPKFSKKFVGIPISKIYDEFQENYHVKMLGSKFTCFSCHDPHVFQRNFLDIQDKIAADNKMCMHCHASMSNLKALTTRKFDNLEVIHAWLPNTETHWKNVRCIDCHTSYDPPNLSHNILPKSKAVKNCEKCHSQNSILMTKLYRYESKKGRQQKGFLNGALLNNSYVIGSTRNSILDKLSILLFGGVFLFIGIHGSMRYISIKKNQQKK